ncbi:MAG: CehA/McbA family metallohydrolase domain-containing protein [Planctomycetota bacterium]|jgi:hypothetical protein
MGSAKKIISQKCLKLKNKIIHTEINPQLGGRIWQFSRADSRSNHLMRDKKLLKKNCSENPGGIAEVLSEDNYRNDPGSLMFTPFKVSNSGQGQVVLNGEIANIAVEKRIKLCENLPCLKEKVSYTNIGTESITTGITRYIRMNGQHKTSESRVIHYNDQKGLTEKFVKFRGHGFDMTPDGWAVFANLKTRENLVILYPSLKVKKVMGKVFPVHVSMIIAGNDTALKPGESIEMTFEYWLVKSEEEKRSLLKSQQILNKKKIKGLKKLFCNLAEPNYMKELKVKNRPVKFVSHGGQGSFVFNFDGMKRQGDKYFLKAGASGIWSFCFKAEADLAEGASLMIRRDNASAFGFQAQTEDRLQDDYTEVKTSSAAKLELSLRNVEYPTRSWHLWIQLSAPAFVIKVVKGRVKKGEEIILTIGQAKKGLKTSILDLRSQPGREEVRDYGVEVYVDRSAERVYRRIGSRLKMFVTHAEPARIITSVNTTADNSGRVRVHVRLEDVFANLCEKYAGELVVDQENINGLPEKIKLSTRDKGFFELEGIIADENLPARVFFTDVETGIRGQSNYCLPKKAAGKYRVFWGELHSHTNRSHDGRGDIDYAVQFGRDTAALDFCAITDHTIPVLFSEKMSKETKQWWQKEWWDRHRKVCTSYAVKEKYVPILAQECHPGDGGDHNVFYPDYKTSLIMPKKSTGSKEEVAKCYKELYREVNKKKCLIIPHVGGGGKDLEYHDEKAEPLVEIASIHGRFEGFAQAALQRGYRVGFVYGSDFHCATPGSSGFIKNPGKLGLPRFKSTQDCNGFTGILSNKLSLGNLMTSLKKHRCYAVMGQSRIFVDFTVNDKPMGSLVKTKDAPHFNIRIFGTEKTRHVFLIRNQSVLKVWQGESEKFSASYTDKDIPKGTNYYYLRVIQENDDLAWSSPVWVDYTGKEINSRRRYRPWDLEEVQDLKNISKNEATQYEKYVEGRLKRLTGGRFHALKGIRVVNNSYGRYALLFGYDRFNRDKHTRFMYMLDDEAFRIGGAWGWQIFNSILNAEQIRGGGKCK